MKWNRDFNDFVFQISDDLQARVFWQGRYSFGVIVNCKGARLWSSAAMESESAAKSAVAAWIGKTIAQLGNALAAGEPRTYDDDGV